MISRIDQQIRVNKIMIDDVDLNKVSNYKCRHYMINYLEIITVVTTVMLLRSGTEENLEKKRELWRYIKNKDIGLFHRLRNGIMGQTMNLPGRSGRKFQLRHTVCRKKWLDLIKRFTVLSHVKICAILHVKHY